MAGKTPDVNRRVKYSDHQFLYSSDFQDEQDYHKYRRWQHNKFLHSYGVCDGGMIVSIDKANDGILNISPGHAFDKEGREITLTVTLPDTCLAYDLTKSGLTQADYYYITVCYSEEDDSTSKVNEAGFSGYTRVLEKAKINHKKADEANIIFDGGDMLGDGYDKNSDDLLLAVVKVNKAAGVLEKVYENPPGRLLAGVKLAQFPMDDLPDGGITSVKLSSDPGNQAVDSGNIRDKAVHLNHMNMEKILEADLQLAEGQKRILDWPGGKVYSTKNGMLVVNVIASNPDSMLTHNFYGVGDDTAGICVVDNSRFPVITSNYRVKVYYFC